MCSPANRHLDLDLDLHDPGLSVCQTPPMPMVGDPLFCRADHVGRTQRQQYRSKATRVRDLARGPGHFPDIRTGGSNRFGGTRVAAQRARFVEASLRVCFLCILLSHVLSCRVPDAPARQPSLLAKRMSFQSLPYESDPAAGPITRSFFAQQQTRSEGLVAAQLRSLDRSRRRFPILCREFWTRSSPPSSSRLLGPIRIFPPLALAGQDPRERA